MLAFTSKRKSLDACFLILKLAFIFLLQIYRRNHKQNNNSVIKNILILDKILSEKECSRSRTKQTPNNTSPEKEKNTVLSPHADSKSAKVSQSTKYLWSFTSKKKKHLNNLPLYLKKQTKKKNE